MFSRMGVRGRLVLSFIGISGFAVLAAAAAMYSFAEVGEVLDRITEKRVPMALTAQELSARVERVVANAPDLLKSETPREQTEIWSALSEESGQIDAQLALLRTHLDAETLIPFENALDPLRLNLQALNTLAQERIVLAERKSVLLASLRESFGNAQSLLATWITNVRHDVSRLRAVGDDVAVMPEARLDAQDEWVAAVNFLVAIEHTRRIITESHSDLVEMATAGRNERLDLIKLRARWSTVELTKLATDVDIQPRALILAEVERIRLYTDDADGMPALRAKEMGLVAEADVVKVENMRFSSELTNSIASLVENTKQDIAQATAQARAVQTRSAVMLIAMVVLSLACSIFIVWLYVDRNLIARLTALSRSMLAIAGGNLQAPLPAPGGSDEISRMAEALIVFRDTAVEVAHSNMREINMMRQRLVGAIESISEGFSLYDAEDRLVVCNSTYKKLLYSGMEDAVTPGKSFETIIREAVARGMIRDAEGRAEEWVAERLALHRNPGEPHLQRRSNGRWVLISERKTDDIGTVAIYADVTELKLRENLLAEKSGALELKSNALEQLSRQLAKYLSPQVYDSIFTGKQEVKVASSRKKLTIFFSDIAGFTETADRLESEELTQLLNHYLTEMSRIALDHGATIDKYVGDAIVIFFGDPETKGVKEDALACVKMAISMRKRMNDLQVIWRDSGIEKPLRVRMGIHTGFCTVGNFGSEDRMDYTIIGGAANIASRLESLATPGEILISYETFAHVKEQIACTEYGELEVKGVAYPVATYQVVDSHEVLERAQDHFCEVHPNLKLDLDLAAMTSHDRGQAAEVLRRALALLSQSEPAVKPSS
jgi:adenylate cyclase